jgi:hypothetical protein
MPVRAASPEGPEQPQRQDDRYREQRADRNYQH